jgi:hypothetical protein
MINNRTFEHRPISELMAIVKNDFTKFDQEGLIDEGTLIKTVMYCNDKLGIPVREVREAAITVVDNKAQLPVDFEKLFYVAALQCSNTTTVSGRNPFDNNFDQTAIYDACVDRETLGCADNYQVVIKRETGPVRYNYNTWTQLGIIGSSDQLHIDCPNKKKKGTYDVTIKDGYFYTPFRTGTLYIMYLGMMKDGEGNITFPFHPIITPYYEWMIKEKILSDAVFNSDAPNIGELLNRAERERVKAWIDAFNFTTDRGYGEYVNTQRKKELGWYNQWFKFFQ